MASNIEETSGFRPLSLKQNDIQKTLIMAGGDGYAT